MSEEYNPNATDGDGDGFVQDGTKWERPVGTQLEGFDADATDGDGDGLVQDGTPFERPVAEAVEVKEENIITGVSSSAGSTERPALAPVENGVIGSGTVKKVKKEPKAAPKPETPVETVAIFSEGNMVWQGLGKIVKGYNIVPKEDAAQWLTLGSVREATPEEVKTNLG
jgi:hypothetical protein